MRAIPRTPPGCRATAHATSRSCGRARTHRGRVPACRAARGGTPSRSPSRPARGRSRHTAYPPALPATFRVVRSPSTMRASYGAHMARSTGGDGEPHPPAPSPLRWRGGAMRGRLFGEATALQLSHPSPSQWRGAGGEVPPSLAPPLPYRRACSGDRVRMFRAVRRASRKEMISCPPSPLISVSAHEGRGEYSSDESGDLRRPRRIRLPLAARPRDAYLRRALYRHPARLLRLHRGDATGAAAHQARHRHFARLHRRRRGARWGDRAACPADRGRGSHPARQLAVVSGPRQWAARPLAETERRAVARQYARRQPRRATERRGGQGGSGRVGGRFDARHTPAHLRDRLLPRGGPEVPRAGRHALCPARRPPPRARR